jgi:hypothetical protein
LRRHYTAQPPGSGKSDLPAAEPFLDVIARMAIGARFRLPGPICAGSFTICESLGPVQRVLMGILWMSSSLLEQRSRGVFRGDILDLRHISGFTSYRRDNEVIAAIELLRDEEIMLSDGEIIPVFETVIFSDDDGVPVVDWVFEERFAELFVEPATYALLDVREIVQLKKGLDLLLFRHARLIWNMRRPKVTMSLMDLRRAAGMTAEQPFKRLAPRLKTAVKRVADVTGGTIEVECFSERGRRKATGASLAVAKPDRKSVA